jgi:hypothetical protein
MSLFTSPRYVNKNNIINPKIGRQDILQIKARPHYSVTWFGSNIFSLTFPYSIGVQSILSGDAKYEFT